MSKSAMRNSPPMPPKQAYVLLLNPQRGLQYTADSRLAEALLFCGRDSVAITCRELS